jgi:transcriptional regulator with XRE-family HTH domain
MIGVAPRPLPSRPAVLTKATLRAAERLGLTQRVLCAVLGVSPASLSRLGRSRTIDPQSKEGELATLFVRLYRGLDTLVGGSDDKARAWLEAENSHLHGVPVELIQSVQGFVRTIEYIDAMRAKN